MLPKIIILSGTILGSVYLFSNSLYLINNSIANRNVLMNENNTNKLFVLNGLTLLFSGATFGYFTYYAIKYNIF